ncbi:hypothetical protein WUBG_01967 [Wuchereria bancrofti]|uniref:Uncharacterized protein n=1 Tax=Wuchereria bancrofti TaxID=6293 RepID=J9FC35_WUCBA|nr:hypothetical protein WUBG_01967 [Wuchereria bancrofti]
MEAKIKQKIKSNSQSILYLRRMPINFISMKDLVSFRKKQYFKNGRIGSYFRETINNIQRLSTGIVAEYGEEISYNESNKVGNTLNGAVLHKDDREGSMRQDRNHEILICCSEDDKRPIMLERKYCEGVKDGSRRAAPSIQSTMQMKELLFPLLLLVGDSCRVSQCHVTIRNECRFSNDKPFKTYFRLKVLLSSLKNETKQSALQMLKDNRT